MFKHSQFEHFNSNPLNLKFTCSNIFHLNHLAFEIYWFKHLYLNYPNLNPLPIQQISYLKFTCSNPLPFEHSNSNHLNLNYLIFELSNSNSLQLEHSSSNLFHLKFTNSNLFHLKFTSSNILNLNTPLKTSLQFEHSA